ncbi:hypothetical protein [Polaromonas sp.]|uniref:hypothetical protein n=1 Tax=Polaromonas sp. TaxID=1869339 RepID=UPI0017DF0AC2|nr:hypothetical protein [Polaromonas sp.]NMM05584.1 hypothetical protein [Polaromonas sp.]
MRAPALLLAFSCALGSWAAPASAGTGSVFLDVNIILNKPGAVAAPASSAAAGIRLSGGWSQVCISEALSEQANALVRVVCGEEQFVAITPLPGKAFFATHGAALRYYLDPGFAGKMVSALGGNSATHIGAGTVTVLPIYNASGADGPLEMLVSF